MVGITDSARLYELFESLYTIAESSGYAPPQGYTRTGIITGLEQSVALNIPSSKHPRDLRGSEQDGHIVLERRVGESWTEISRVKIPKPQ